MEGHYLIVGLGNPGTFYEGTRHNIGFRVLNVLAQKLGAFFRPALAHAKGNIANAKRGDQMLTMLMPLTYMNESGLAVRKCLDYFKIPISRCLIVVDDADLPLGTLRLRKKGSSGGHNGLKSVAAYLNTEEYARLRIGIGRAADKGPLVDHVLGRFDAEEEKELPIITEQAVEAIEAWIGEQDDQS